jgi:predicted TIM-barrel fold metal-dependent hydrolase
MIIDFRLRPPYEGYLGTQMYSAQTIGWINRVIATNMPDGPVAALESSMPKLLQEMDQAGVTTGVTLGRHRPGTEIPNEVLLRLTREYPGRFIALASVDVTDTQHGMAMIDQAVGDYKFPGISLDLSVLNMRVDDKRVYPIYEHCAKHGCCVAITLSMLGAQEFELIDPADLDRAARDFPKVNFVSAHGSYPYVLEVIGVAMKRENVWLSPDMYMTHTPGGHLYVEAAQGYLQDRTLFGTAYPYTPLQDTVDRFMRLPFTDAVREKVLHANAQRLLGL